MSACFRELAALREDQGLMSRISLMAHSYLFIFFKWSVPGDTILSSEGQGQQAHTFFSDIYADNIVINRKEVFLKKIKKNNLMCMLNWPHPTPNGYWWVKHK